MQNWPQRILKTGKSRKNSDEELKTQKYSLMFFSIHFLACRSKYHNFVNREYILLCDPVRLTPSANVEVEILSKMTYYLVIQLEFKKISWQPIAFQVFLTNWHSLKNTNHQIFDKYCGKETVVYLFGEKNVRGK